MQQIYLFICLRDIQLNINKYLPAKKLIYLNEVFI